MSQENVGAFMRGIEAYNRQDAEAMLKECDPEVQFHAVLQSMFGGEPAVYRGHEGVRDVLRDQDDALAEQHVEISEIRDLGERIVAVGRLSGRGKESGAEVESPIGYLVEFKNGKAIRIYDFLDPQQALEAAGLRK